MRVREEQPDEDDSAGEEGGEDRCEGRIRLDPGMPMQGFDEHCRCEARHERAGKDEEHRWRGAEGAFLIVFEYDSGKQQASRDAGKDAVADSVAEQGRAAYQENSPQEPAAQ